MTGEAASNYTRRRRKPLEDRSALGIGVLTVAGIAVVMVVALWVTSAGIGKVSYAAEFAQAAGVSAGDAVTIAGVPVGTVDGVRLAGDHVVVTMQIDEGVSLGTGTAASIKLTTLLGSRYVEIRPGGDGEIADHRIRLANTEVPYDLQQTLDNATTTFEQVDAEKIGQTLTTLSDQLAGTPALVPQVLANIENLSSVLADRRGQIGSLLTSTGEVTTVIRAQQNSLGELVRNGRDVLEDITARREVVDQLLVSTAALVDQLKNIVVNDSPAIDELITNLDGLLQSLSNNDDLLRNTLEILPVPLRNFANTSGTANEVDFTAPAGPFIDSWMCAVSGHANEMNLPPYLKDCK